jgi:hypothetical protein
VPLRIASLLAAAVLAAGCGDDDVDDGARPTSTTSTTTTIEVTTTATTAEVTTTTEPVELGDAPAFSASGPSGSGCTPGGGDLPDGWWYGVSVAFDRADGAAGAYTFDLACYFAGDAAYAEGERLGVEVNNDHLVTNDNPALRTVPLAAGATATCVELGAGVSEVPCDPAEVPDPEIPWAVWFRVVDGEVDRLVEQYAP